MPVWRLDGTQFWILPTDGHPNSIAHGIMAKALAAYLGPLVVPGAVAPIKRLS